MCFVVCNDDKEKAKSKVIPGVEADDGLIGEHPTYVKCPAGFANPAVTQAMQDRARMRQETINKRSKDFTCLSQTWTHDPGNHWLAFHSIAVILQLRIDAGEK